MDRQKRAGLQTHSRVSLGVFAFLSKHRMSVLTRKNACSVWHIKSQGCEVLGGENRDIRGVWRCLSA